MRLLSSFAICTIAVATLSSCHESLEDRAERESKEYTEKFCPTPPQNSVITDSLVFDRKTKTQIYYMTFTGLIDNADAIKSQEKKLEKAMLTSLRQNPQIEPYKEAGFTFEYVCRSQKDSKIVLLHCKFGPKQYSDGIRNKE